MKFCVVIPLYNKENHIQRAINSVLTQTVQEFELIVVDDGSTDRSFEVASAIQDSRIRIIRQENHGVSAARNRGIMEAKHEWVAFLDADDEWLPSFLDEISVLINLFPKSILAGTGYYQQDPGMALSVNVVNLPVSIGWRGIIDNYFTAISASHLFNSSSFAAKKSALLEAGLYPEGVAISEDPSLYFRLALIGNFAFSYTPLSIYHREAENRIWHGFGTEELYVVKVGKEIITSENTSWETKESLYEYLVRAELGRIRALLYKGKNREAQEILEFCSKTTNNSETVRKLLWWAKAPSFFYRFLFIVKDRLKLFIKYLDDIV
jgi:glycosyltransferase involved in cell wall biosynthesis